MGEMRQADIFVAIVILLLLLASVFIVIVVIIIDIVGTNHYYSIHPVIVNHIRWMKLTIRLLSIGVPGDAINMPVLQSPLAQFKLLLRSTTVGTSSFSSSPHCSAYWSDGNASRES
jgi:hypothetical protein